MIIVLKTPIILKHGVDWMKVRSKLHTSNTYVENDQNPLPNKFGLLSFWFSSLELIF